MKKIILMQFIIKNRSIEIDIKDIISELRNEKINGINVTVPFKQSIIPFVDELSVEANNASVSKYNL